MTAAYRLKGLGWFASCVGIVLGFYLISLQVAAERKKLDGLNGRIASARRDIRALETEFDTRANLAQLERWNGDTLALVAPTAGQFVRDEAGLAQIDFNQAPGGPQVQMASYVVPSISDAVPAIVPAVATTPAPQPAPKPAPNPVVVRVAARDPLPAPQRAIVRALDPVRSMARVAAAERAVAVSKVRPQAVAMLDRKLLSDSTLGDILSGARNEAGRRR